MTSQRINVPTLGFIYDAMGNFTSKTVSGVLSSYSYGDTAHPYAVTSATNVGGGTYSASYDADGNMALRNSYQIQWPVDDVQGCTSAAGGRWPRAANLPAGIASVAGDIAFSYGPDHNRYYQAATFNGVTTDTTYIGSLF